MNKIILGVVAIAAIGAAGTYFMFPRDKGNQITQEEVTTPQPPHEQVVTPAFDVNLDEQGRALHGYDPVAYFEKGQPVLGTRNLEVSWNKATWQFSNAENKAKFEQNPVKFTPANGGFCTFGVAMGQKFDGDPSVWLIKEGQLYVFLNPDIKNKFMQDEVGNIDKANGFWPEIKTKSAEELETEE